MIEVVAVARPLGPPHARQRTVERVAEPVRDEQPAGHPQPDGVTVGERVGGRDPDRRQHPKRRQVIGHQPARQAAGDPLEHAGLGAGEQEGLLTSGGHGGSDSLLTDGR
jgi:hypothetical protein